ncbi:hypothetical protein DFH07DRAFT_776409 [Mycena maculata]|uniref:Beta-galactosidase jelly roll domain-containing protein n=1 Tax=Mycena maculata TaxID=230809 RepID=A0AAD7N4F1_9AGAR|nr:hypothetical protein DFH07DRAFT_776409 [Mycena maculata]
MAAPFRRLLTVIRDSTRGLLLAEFVGTLLSDSDSTEWRLAGNIEGENAPDYVRGLYNEVIRPPDPVFELNPWVPEGANLPGYDALAWNKSCTPHDGTDMPGVIAYRTKFNLSFLIGADIHLVFDFSLDSAAPYRTLIYLNGWQFEGAVPQTRLAPGSPRLSPTNVSLTSSKLATVTIVPAPGWAELRGNVTTN